MKVLTCAALRHLEMEFPESHYLDYIFEIIDVPQIVHRQSPHTWFCLPVKAEAGKERVRHVPERNHYARLGQRAVGWPRPRYI